MPDQKKAIKTLYEKLAEVHALDPVLSLSTLTIFLYIAGHEGCIMHDLMTALKLNQPAVARHIQRLGKGSPTSKAVGKGLGWVETRPDPADVRRFTLYLTPAGLAVRDQLTIG